MAADPSDVSREAPRPLQLILKLVVLALIVAVLGLPINDLLRYALVLIAVIVLAVGRVTSRRRSWAVALAVVAIAIGGKTAIHVPQIEEGHNLFLPGGSNNALMTGLPPTVYDAMAAEFDRAYPAAVRCDPKAAGCWQASERPRRAYAFSFDGLYDKPVYSRRVTRIDFADAEWQRLGFINELATNWYTAPPDVSRGRPRRGLQRLLHPWHVTMPHFVMFGFPAAFNGSRLCWQGTVLWEEAGGKFAPLQHAERSCRSLQAGDAGRRIYGLSIAPDATLTMALQPTAAIRLLQLYRPVAGVVATLALLFLLLRWRARQLALPLIFVALSLLVIFLTNATFLGGVRPFDGGNDGLMYDGWARIMAQQILAGDIVGALQGGEAVFHFTPGARYLRLLEHFASGETYLGYLSLLLLLPFLVFVLFRRFLGPRPALAAALIFIAIPIGGLFGSTLYNYAKHAAQGFGDPAGAIFFLAGIVALLGRSTRGPRDRFMPALGGAFFLAIAVSVRPNLAVGAATLLGGAGLAALYKRQLLRLAGMCIGFLPVFSMALHNWYYGGAFVLFSGHTVDIEGAIPMPPRAYLSALWEMLHLDFNGESLRRGAWQLRLMLIGPAELVAMIPLHAAALIVIARVLLSRRYDGWLRLVAATTLGLTTPALFFLYSDRYQLLAWLLTLLICLAWVQREALPWFKRRFPDAAARASRSPALLRTERWLDRLTSAA